MAARLPIYMADVRDNPRWLAMFALGRFLPVRRALWRLAQEGASRDCGGSMFGDDAVAATHELRTEGLFTGLLLPEAVCADILRFAQSTPCFANLSRRVEFLSSAHDDAARRLRRPVLTGHYFNRVEDCPAVSAVRGDPFLHAVAAAYLGREARVISTRLWWSFPTGGGASDAELSLASQDKLHFDLDDWRALKFFFYVTPVGRDGGPHVYIRRTHNRRVARHQWTLTVGHPNEEVLKAYGPENQVTVLGGAGHGFAVDPFGFHMGTVVRRAPRLMLEVGFGVSSVFGRRFHGEPGRSTPS